MFKLPQTNFQQFEIDICLNLYFNSTERQSFFNQLLNILKYIRHSFVNPALPFTVKSLFIIQPEPTRRRIEM